jgi:hypothetical protein
MEQIKKDSPKNYGWSLKLLTHLDFQILIWYRIRIQKYLTFWKHKKGQTTNTLKYNNYVCALCNVDSQIWATVVK